MTSHTKKVSYSLVFLNGYPFVCHSLAIQQLGLSTGKNWHLLEWLRLSVLGLSVRKNCYPFKWLELYVQRYYNFSLVSIPKQFRCQSPGILEWSHYEVCLQIVMDLSLLLSSHLRFHVIIRFSTVSPSTLILLNT